MASSSDNHETTYIDSSSDDENLLTVKRKAEDFNDGDKKCKYEEDSDDEPIMPGVLVTVEVEEMDNDPPLEFNESDIPKRKGKQQKKNSQPVKKKVLECSECKMQFLTTPELKKHCLQEHQVKTRHKCEICNRYFKKAFSLRMHSKVHMEKISPQCQLCGEEFAQKNYLTEHMEYHERTEHCDMCEAKFHTQNQLKNHKKQVHSGKRGQEDSEKGNFNQSMSFNSTNQSSEAGDNTQSDQDMRTERPEDDFGKTHFLFNEYEGLRREDLSHSTICAIVNKMHKGRSIPDICRLYNLTPETIDEIWEDREKYVLPRRGIKRTSKYMNSILDTKVVEWFNNERAKNVHVSGKMVQDMAEAFAKECGFVAFNGSRKWLDRFKKRYNISLRPSAPKREYRNHLYDSKWKNHFFNEQWSDARLGIDDEDIYTADEFGLYYNPSKGRIKKLGGKKFIQGYVKDRLSVFICANMYGTDKKKLLVCGTEDPLMHSHRNLDTLPVNYIRHSQAHFTTQMFENYVRFWNEELAITNRKAILVLDRATIHSKLQLSHLKLVFVPWKASNGLIPMKNGVFAKFREEFRRLILQEKAMNALRGVDRNLTCLETLNMLEKAWERTPPNVITKSFVDTGYDVTLPEESTSIDGPKVHENDDEVLANLLKDYDVESYYTHLSNLDQYLTVDEEQVTGQGTNFSVFGGNHKVNNEPTPYDDKDDLLPVGTEKPESDEKEALVKKSRALQDLDIVRKFLQSNATSHDTFCRFMEVENFVMQTVIG